MPLYSFKATVTYHDEVVIDAEDEDHARELVAETGFTGSHIVSHDADLDPEIKLHLDEED
ncbi:hypothetical protein HOT99_gp177 [Caulobacter phage CcrBL10]|uniref:Uncharacterized protein n=1 Tax=Caulobacter phage CcrBL10 TaxID=2283269 RepID=A0A385E9T4_9CAUD|nr:hypothetical protein HOT99_gp177 [Caulobacter phage CcrBL10]AXQ68440.1 hypothetical protein CcrBL10_gp236 [Caulobacter phage CcrBL10]